MGTLAVHPFQTGPNRGDKVMRGVAMEAPHRLVFAPGVLEALNALPPLEGRPVDSPHPAHCLRGLNPEPSQRGHSSPSCLKHSTNSGDSCAERAKLDSIKDLSYLVQASGCWRTAGAVSLSDTPILAFIC